jgi:hypothetical protein
MPLHSRLIAPAKNWIATATNFSPFPAIFAVLPTSPPVKMIADLSSAPVKLLWREIRKIAARLDTSASLDELDQAWATLCRLQDALEFATERAKGIADD